MVASKARAKQSSRRPQAITGRSKGPSGSVPAARKWTAWILPAALLLATIFYGFYTGELRLGTNAPWHDREGPGLQQDN